MNSDLIEVDIAIVGGGMVGLSLAAMLASQKAYGHTICVIDALPFEHSGGSASPDYQQPMHQQPSFDARSTAISAGSAQVLNQLGCWRSIAKSAQAIESVKVSDKGQLGFSEFHQEENNHEALGFVVENRKLGEALKAFIKNQTQVGIVSPASVSHLKPATNGVFFDVQPSAQTPVKPQAYFAKLLVLADGAQSENAVRLGIQFQTRDYRQHAVVANVEHTEPHDGVAYEHFTESGPLAFLPLQSERGVHRSAIVWTHADTQISSMTSLSDDAFIERLQQHIGYRLGQITRVGKRDSYPLKLISADEQVRRNVVLIGNAAHLLHPVAGQGFNLALRDCVALSNHIKKGLDGGRELGDLEDLLHYARGREADQWATTELSHQFIGMFMSSRAISRGLRTVGLSSLNKIQPLKSAFFKQMMGQGLNKVRLR